MMRLLLFSYLSFFIIACNNENSQVLNIVGGCNNLYSGHLSWIEEKVQKESESSDFFEQYAWFKTFSYKGQALIVLGFCCPFCNWIPTYYTCDGELVEPSKEEFQKLNYLWQNTPYLWKGSECYNE